MSRLGVTLTLLLAASGPGCSHGAPPVPKQTRTIQPEVVLAPDGAPEARLKVELARTEEEQRVGLMYRTRLEPGWGMLFLFREQRQQVFWMHNTHVALDMIFIRNDRVVLGVVDSAEPDTDTPRMVKGTSQYVLEVPAGFASAAKIRPGTRVQFVDIETL